MKIYLGFSKAKSKWAFLSKLIMWCQEVPFSHVYMRVDSQSLQRSLIYQASGLKVNFENKGIFDSHAQIVSEFELDVEQETYKKVMQFAIDNVGKPYSKKQLIGMAFVSLGRKMGLNLKNPYKDRRDAFICSELVADIIDIVDPSSDLALKSEDLGPKEIYEFLKKEQIK
jgi:hypothetical protein